MPVMHWTLLCVGRIRLPWIEDGCREYLERLHPLLRLEVHEVAESREKDPARQKRDESSRLLSAMHKHGGGAIVLDETGERMTSAAFAALLSKALDAGDQTQFVIGGAYGLTDEVRAAAKKVVRLSDMTFTHEMARLILLEQLYRAMQIRRGSGYHH